MDTVHMIGAELLKLRRRSLIVWTGALTVGVSVAFVVFNAVRHHMDATRYPPAGGVTNLAHGMQLLGYLGTVAAVLLGTTAGGQDQDSGVFRDLVTTGRPRWTLFAVRLPAALISYLVWLVPAYTVTAVASVTLAGDLTAPGAGMLIQFGVGLGLSTLLDVVLAVGLTAAIGSRSIVIGVLLGWELAISRLVEHMTSFGALRQLLPSAAVDRILPVMGAPRIVPMTVLTAVLVPVIWAMVVTAAGAWKTTTRDA